METRNFFETVEGLYVSAEFDYFRIGREKWELFLTRLAQMGVQCISIRVPWGFHEIHRGTIELTGVTQARRNLVELLDLCRAFKFQCLLQLGPYGNSDLLNKGLPFWLNQEAGEGDLSAAIEGWYVGVSRVLVEQQWPDGPVVLLQLNQRATPTLISASPEVTRVKWPIWLRKRYQGIEALNRAYGADYRSVSEVDFPEHRSEEKTPQEKDAQLFLSEVQSETEERYLQLLAEAGWQIPIQAPGLDEGAPSVQPISLVEAEEAVVFEAGERIVLLRQPIQVDPDPVDVGAGPVWARGAPIRADGSVRRRFWQLRADIWRQNRPPTIDHRPLQDVLGDAPPARDDSLLIVTFEKGGLVASAQDMPLKLNLGKGTVYRLDLSGEIREADNLAVTRGKLSGAYLVEERGGQTDFVFLIDNPAKALPVFLATYLQTLLRSQAESLARSAWRAAALGHMFDASDEAHAPAGRPGAPAATPYTLAEARRGLHEADAILRKAMASIGDLEAGFETMLGRRETAGPKPATASANLTPEIFEGAPRDILIEAGQTCKEIAPQLEAAAAALRALLDEATPLRLEGYRQGQATAVSTAQRCREPLLELLARLRAEIASESLPLVMWRAHDQLQSIAERLRWGVGRL